MYSHGLYYKLPVVSLGDVKFIPNIGDALAPCCQLSDWDVPGGTLCEDLNRQAPEKEKKGKVKVKGQRSDRVTKEVGSLVPLPNIF